MSFNKPNCASYLHFTISKRVKNPFKSIWKKEYIWKNGLEFFSIKIQKQCWKNSLDLMDLTQRVRKAHVSWLRVPLSLWRDYWFNNYSELLMHDRMKVYESANLNIDYCWHLDRYICYTVSPNIIALEKKEKKLDCNLNLRPFHCNYQFQLGCTILMKLPHFRSTKISHLRVSTSIGFNTS